MDRSRRSKKGYNKPKSSSAQERQKKPASQTKPPPSEQDQAAAQWRMPIENIDPQIAQDKEPEETPHYEISSVSNELGNMSLEDITVRVRPHRTRRQAKRVSVVEEKGEKVTSDNQPQKDGHRRQRDLAADNWRQNASPLSAPTTPKKAYVHPDDIVRNNRRRLFSPFMGPATIENEVKEKKLYKGILRINRRKRGDSYVTSDDLDADVYIYGQRFRNRALDGDVVAVRLMDVDPIWNSRKERDEERRAERDTSNDVPTIIGNDNENENEEEEDAGKPKYCGEIVGIMEREKDKVFVGTVTVQRPSVKKKEQEDNTDANCVWFKPSDKRTPLFCISLRDAPKDILTNCEGLIMKAQIRSWPITALFPWGRITGELGSTGDLTVLADAILVDNNIQTNDFSPVIYKGLPTTPWSIPRKEYQKRRNLCNELVFTIDPATAKDLDDAVHIKRLDDGFLEVGVHIADVSFFMKKETPLDSEARQRGTSTYLVDRVIPMLPNVLCEELCSLNPGVERLAFSVIWKMDKEGKTVDTWFGRTIIQSCAKLAYEDAQSVIDGQSLPPTANVMDRTHVAAIERNITDLFHLSQAMRRRRYETGALSMNSVKLCFTLDEEGNPISVYTFEAKEANRLIEEFMLRANISVAEKISRHYPDEALLRRHPEPIERRLDEFVALTNDLGYEIDSSSAGSLQSSFDKINHPDIKEILLILAIKPMQRAKYFCSGSIDISKHLHYALNEPLYTHFTSPIRRYADVIVHRQLEAALSRRETCGIQQKIVQKIALHCNRRKDAAKAAQDENIMIYLSRYLRKLEEDQGPIYEKAIVLAVHVKALEIYVPKYGLERRIPMDSLPLEKVEYDKINQALFLYWKKGKQVSTHTEKELYAEEREREDDYSDSLEDDDDGADVVEPPESLEEDACDDITRANQRIVRIPEQMIQEKFIDKELCMQRFQMFTQLDVLLQVNVDSVTSFINVYPLNPFA